MTRAIWLGPMTFPERKLLLRRLWPVAVLALDVVAVLVLVKVLL